MLAIDIGNSTTVFASISGARVRERFSLRTSELAAGAIADAVSRLKDGEGTAVASVVPAATEMLMEAISTGDIDTTVLIDSAGHTIMANALESVSTTGIDRLLAARAARDIHAPGEGGIIVIQAGSAVTVDMVDSSGVFQGGFILPGPAMWLGALGTAAAIPDFHLDEMGWNVPDKAGKCTREAVMGGLAAGLTGAITESARILAKSCGGRVSRIITGGWSSKIYPMLDFETVLAPDLVLQGIEIVGKEIISE
ncbi:MAG: type III pantothenate kinase [Planctomycetes bacterium]|nr:type III pantothenate kinase [Planctomycetota bacterium]